MKLNRIFTMCAVAAALVLTAGSTFAQDNANGNGNGNGNANGNENGGGQRRNRQGGGGGFGGGNFDPAQMQQRIMDNVRDQLNFTNDTDWAAVQPLVQKVLDTRRDVGFGNMRGLFGRPRGQGGQGGGGGGRGGFGGQPGPEQEALQNALDADAPAAQIKDLLAKYKASQQAKQSKYEAAQDALKSVLTSKQEAQAYLLGLVR
jgi:Spy/CpxP family protein refolding chaperone